MNYEKRNQQILDFVQTHSEEETARFFNLSQSRIHQIVKSSGLKLKKSRINLSKLNLDIDYFKEINTPEKAYWLGFICADGYINNLNNKLSIFVKDLEILQKFKKDIKSEHKISERFVFDRRTNKTYHEYCIQIGNEMFVRNLINWVTHNKTDILQFPNILEEYYSYFIAGLFDGDGSIYLKNNGVSTVLNINLISTKEILDFIQNYFLNFNISWHKYTKISKNKDNVFKIYWYKDTIKILDFIYSGDPKIYLSRKYNLYKKYRDLKPTRNRIQPVLKYNKDGDFIQLYPSLKEAGMSVGVSNASICQAVKRKTLFKNFYWVYYNNDIICNTININLWKKTNIIQAVEKHPNG